MNKEAPAELSRVFEAAAELFGLLSAPLRLKIMCALCEGEKSVSGLLACIDATQPNMSQHLSTLYRAGVLARRRDGAQIYYRVQSDRALTVCRVVCEKLPIEGMFCSSEAASPERAAAPRTTTRRQRGS